MERSLYWSNERDVSGFIRHLRCQSIPQAEWQLLILRKSNASPKISVYAHVYGPHDYNTAHFVPVGMKTLVHDKTKRRGKFVDYCSEVFVLCTSFEQYRSWVM